MSEKFPDTPPEELLHDKNPDYRAETNATGSTSATSELAAMIEREKDLSHAPDLDTLIERASDRSDPKIDWAVVVPALVLALGVVA